MCDSAKGGCGSKKTISGAESAMNMVPLEKTNEAVENLTDSLPISGSRVVIRNRSFYNMFATKKTVAQGMMDIALITANANQLRYLIEYCQKSSSYYIVFALIIISLFLQMIVGVFLIFKGRQHLRRQKSEHATARVNNCIVFGVFLITVINVFISAFSVNGLASRYPQTQN